MRLLWAFPILVLTSLIKAPFNAPLEGGGRSLRFSQIDSTIFDEKKAIVAKNVSEPHAAQALAVARSFLGIPYVTGTLDHNTKEQLVINLRQLDCWTLVEASLAFALNGSEGNFDTFQQHIQQLRYWGGTIDSYGSRIHYFTGWLLQAEKMGYLEDVTRDLGGIPYKKKIGYITARPQKYPKIKDPAILQALRSAEARINHHPWYFIPKARIAMKEHLIREGDLIILTSAKGDLDIAHQGFAVRRNGRIHLLHASSLAKKVIITGQPLAQYMAKQRGQTGIMVARIRD